MARGEEIDIPHPENEQVLLLMKGRCSIQADDRQFSGLRRTGIFEERATAVYAPPGMRCHIAAEDDTEVAVVSAKAGTRYDPCLVRPDDVKVRRIGKSNWYREVHDVIDTRVEAERLLVGETFNPPGNWSSYPPHRHERSDFPAESRHEEFYHFRLNPPTGFGIQRVYTDDGQIDETIVLRDRDTVAIPRGYHPVVSAPGYHLYYLWALAGEGRQLIAREDPLHSWTAEPRT